MTERLLFLDFETFWSQDYSLTKMTPPEYILDPRFETQGLAYAYDSEPTGWVDGPDVQDWVTQQDWANLTAVAHNMQFDGAILAWRYGIVPKHYVDTLGMARALYGSKFRSMSLATLSESLLGAKKGNALMNTKGLTFREIQRSPFYGEFIKYAVTDVNLCRQLFFRMVQEFPVENEIALVDELVRMVTKPKFELDVTALSMHLIELREHKDKLLKRLDVDRAALLSNDKFAVLLEERGVDPPRKISPTTGKLTWAFAKTDEEFLALAEHEDEEISLLANARLGVKSTIEETRTESFVDIGMLPWPNGKRCMPVPLRYSGAHTHRFSGDWRLNLQNLPRKSPIRKAMRAPDGMVVVAADASQIEARVVTWLAGQKDLLNVFATGGDPYCAFASKVYDRTITKTDKVERQVGKTAVLGLGFGMGAAKFEITLKRMAGIDAGSDFAQDVVSTYRTAYPRIPTLWSQCEGGLRALLMGDTYRIGPLMFEKSGILLPSGLRIEYPKLYRDEEGQYTYETGRGKKYLFGGKVTENGVQALARIATMGAHLKMRKLLPGLELALQVHDQLVYVVPKEIGDDFLALLIQTMSEAPEWAPGLPLGAEGGIGETLAEAEGK